MNQWDGVTPEVRFLKKLVISEAACWAWDGTHDSKGYGLFWFNRRFTGAHRYSYEYYIGPIPAGLELDHLCRNKGCVNPWHLEPVTHLENMRRSDAKSRKRRALRSTCRNGHEYTDATVRYERGNRRCRICAAEVNRRYRARHRGFLVGTGSNDAV